MKHLNRILNIYDCITLCVFINLRYDHNNYLGSFFGEESLQRHKF